MNIFLGQIDFQKYFANAGSNLRVCILLYPEHLKNLIKKKKKKKLKVIDDSMSLPSLQVFSFATDFSLADDLYSYLKRKLRVLIPLPTVTHRHSYSFPLAPIKELPFVFCFRLILPLVP